MKQTKNRRFWRNILHLRFYNEPDNALHLFYTFLDRGKHGKRRISKF